MVADRFLAVPLAQFGVATEGLDPAELEHLAVWATGRLRPDVSVVLDRAPTGGVAHAAAMAGEEHVRVRRLLTHMAAAEPHRYVVVDADGPPAEVAERVAAALAPLLLPARPTSPPEHPGELAPATAAGPRSGMSGSATPSVSITTRSAGPSSAGAPRPDRTAADTSPLAAPGTSPPSRRVPAEPSPDVEHTRGRAAASNLSPPRPTDTPRLSDEPEPGVGAS